ncbi:MAG: hypothetical protein HZB62_07730 [Nitrospirae bacterium]|nr:hypothetical protein [Nitrospirota bacterium]
MKRQNVGQGDLFLFFGWFRRVLKSNDKLCYDLDAPHIHCLFGWLQVGNVYHPGAEDSILPKWAFDHPHVQYAGEDYYKRAKNNTLYIASPCQFVLDCENCPKALDWIKEIFKANIV